MSQYDDTVAELDRRIANGDEVTEEEIYQLRGLCNTPGVEKTIDRLIASRTAKGRGPKK